jgi:hypothetical protein
MENALTKEEQEELIALKQAINDNVSSVHYDKMERFTELFVKTISGKGETGVFVEPTNF